MKSRTRSREKQNNIKSKIELKMNLDDSHEVGCEHQCFITAMLLKQVPGGSSCRWIHSTRRLVEKDDLWITNQGNRTTEISNGLQGNQRSIALIITNQRHCRYIALWLWMKLIKGPESDIGIDNNDVGHRDSHKNRSQRSPSKPHFPFF